MTMVAELSKCHVIMDYKVSNMFNIQSEHNYVILSNIIQLVNYMFRPLYLSIIMFVYTLLNGEVAGWCRNLLLLLHCHGHSVVDNAPC